jgi:hypothetical protein
MPRRKKIESDEESSEIKRGAKKNRRVDLKVRVAKPLPENREELEEEYGEVIDNSDNLTRKAIDEVAISPETVEEIAQKIAELKIERDKKLLMWVGVTFIMAIVLVLWIINLKNMFREQARQNQIGKELNIDQISEQFNKTMDEVSTNLNQLNEISTATSTLASTSPSTNLVTSTSTVNFEETAEIQQLRARLEELERRLNVSATTTNKKVK